MNQDEIIEMARKAGIRIDSFGFQGGFIEEFEAFTNLVAQEVRDRIMFGSRDDWVLAEREACAKLCDSFYESWIKIHGRYEFMGEGAQECAGAIRARGEA